MDYVITPWDINIKWSISKVVSRYRRELQILNVQHTLNLWWGHVHNNILGNEIVDELTIAEEYMDLNTSCADVYHSLDFVYRSIRYKFKIEWDNSSRIKKGIINGHNELKYFIKEIKLCNANTFQWCNEEEEDTFHFLRQCIALSRYRFHCFESYFFQNVKELKRLIVNNEVYVMRQVVFRVNNQALQRELKGISNVTFYGDTNKT
ncbi:hypothetical protein FF38_07672 [Lucilia cuprina]|uniref:Uncharacterized protein n=1 Tax=Lucilia cuprina TaxID=7375 RepID=A0A0L0BNQ9_LUCCU|nr:hypothetical protein FF38_07672 [Lucilia cuprina]